jgi:hypothetical protein
MVDDVQRAIWAIEGKCKGCGAIRRDFLEIHDKSCEYDTNFEWFNALDKHFSTYSTTKFSEPFGGEMLYQGRRIDKAHMKELLMAYLAHRNEFKTTQESQ